MQGGWPSLLLTGETWFFLLMHVKNYRSANLLACNQFISDPFPWKKMGLVEWGVKGKVSRQSRVAKVRVAEDQGGKPPGGLRPVAQEPRTPQAPERETERQKKRQRDRESECVLCSEDSHSWWDRREKVTY